MTDKETKAPAQAPEDPRTKTLEEGQAVRKGIDVLPSANVPAEQAPPSGSLPPADSSSSEGEAGEG
jgi:hypothetical protein